MIKINSSKKKKKMNKCNQIEKTTNCSFKNSKVVRYSDINNEIRLFLNSKLILKKQVLPKVKIKGKKLAGMITFWTVDGGYLIKMVISAQIDNPSKRALTSKNIKLTGRLVDFLITWVAVAIWGLRMYLLSKIEAEVKSGFFNLFILSEFNKFSSSDLVLG